MKLFATDQPMYKTREFTIQIADREIIELKNDSETSKKLDRINEIIISNASMSDKVIALAAFVKLIEDCDSIKVITE